ncbi:pentatricopeptide repeat-containing protein At1g28690, mitochondrial-like [Malus domestica]|uniref:pentatricopeptide repeat-containing protein At1g28690, mitochondrial-like n=1 Tax=Malus domestica TaxID=3750 RepID=UPI0010A9BA57|nr:pentatricopeptide repeat-containing protein At1g28690, mitochondrial-like [Malus domestica]
MPPPPNQVLPPPQGSVSQSIATTLSSALQHFINSDNPSHGQKIHTHILKSGFRPNVNISIKLLILHLKCGSLAYARKVFDELPAQTLSAYNYLIGGYLKRAKTLTLRMGRSSMRGLFDMTLEKNVICSTSMISGYMNWGSVEDAEDIFRKTVEKDVVVFNAMIEGYSKLVEYARISLEVYIDMQRLNFLPNLSTFASVIGACSVLASFEVGQQFQSHLMKAGLFLDIKMGCALIDMYSKCGRVEDARRVFDHMPEKNVFSWTSMIDGYGKNGYPDKALELFRMMQRKHQIEPNFVTFLSALSACRHAGLVDKGMEIFESMDRDYSLKPRMEHYACMVDLLGRAGSLCQAWEFAMEMPEKPNSDVWAALLSSSTLHGDVDMANMMNSGELVGSRMVYFWRQTGIKKQRAKIRGM